MSFSNIFKGKKVLITGHTGFKGSWLSLWLSNLGAQVCGLSIEIPSSPAHYSAIKLSDNIKDLRIDIRDPKSIKKAITDFQPDYIFHLAAQALVRPSYEDPLDTMLTNAIGSANLLDSLRFIDKNVVVIMITSDKAYDNLEWVWGYRETDRIGGKDPYSASKGMAEIAIRSYVESFFSEQDTNIRIGITRAGNVIGGGDWAKDRIVPDCVNSWSKNQIVNIRNPLATRPWQHVLEPLSGYLSLAEQLTTNIKFHGEAYNFGPRIHQDYSVKDLINEMSIYWESVRWKDVSVMKDNLYEARLLKLNCDKAMHELNWQPTLKFKETVEMTAKWYRMYYENNNESMYKYSLDQINEYTKYARERSMAWTNI